MKYIKMFLLLFIASSAIGQPIADYKKYKQLTPNAEAIVSSYNADLKITLVNDKIAVAYHTREEFFYLGKNVNGYSDRSIDYSKFYVLKDYQAYTLVPSGNRYKKIMVDKFKKNDFVENGIFLDDQRELKFILPNIEQEAKSVIETNYELTDPHMLPKFSLSPYLDYYNVVFTITHDEGIDISIDTLNLGTIVNKHIITKKGKTVKHEWRIDAPKKFNYESSGPDAHYISPQILFRLKSYQVKGEKINVLNDLNDLHKWYCNFISQSEEGFDGFKMLSDSIAGNATNEMEKASRIYDWVQKNVRYIAFEEGYAGLIPAKASLVCKERYGDCKGMANLLYHLLRAQNIDAHLCWIGTRSLPYRYSKIPSPAVDNHMITAIKVNTGYLFLDATHANLPFGMPSPFIQGKETLISDVDCKGFILAEVPETSAEANNFYDSCAIQIKGKDVTGSGLAVLTGYTRMNFTDELEDKSYKFLIKQCRYFLLKGNNKFVLDTVWLENALDKNKPLRIHYKFRIPDYVILIDGEYYINLNLDKVSIPGKLAVERNVAVNYRYKNSDESVVNLMMDQVNKDQLLPPDTSMREPFYYFENSFKKSKNNIIRRQKWIKNQLMLQPADFKQYNNIIDAMQKNYQEQITINIKLK
ncbi:MAG: transglutaminase domain-containing protein [Bacteroidia bacterium]|nr:transglutaminase domain-containing protein [Bacteroidia bacterium]